MSRFLSSVRQVTKLVKDDQDAKESFDIVIVGGGTAGCVLASRLTEDPNIRVLIIESGDSSSDVLFSNIPAAYSQLFHSKHVFEFYTTPQENAGGSRRFWPRAKLLGGCSAINAQMFQYGAPSDYDEWADILGESKDTSAWSYKNFHKYFLKFEKFVPHPDFPLDTSLRGSSGPVEIGYNGNFSPISLQFLEACEQVGIPRVPDVNTPKGTMGATKTMTYIDSNGRRVTTQSAYLTSDVLKRPNLKVVVNATVTKILFDQQGATPRATGVEFAKSETGPRFEVRARKEVILATGAVHTPQILMVSGIGPAEHLRSHNIPVVANLAGVGAHLMDHPVVDINLRDKGSNSLAFIVPKVSVTDGLRLSAAMVQWLVSGKGPMTCNVGEGFAFLRSLDTGLFPAGESSKVPEDSTSGSDAPDIELFVGPVAYQEHAKVIIDHAFSIHGILLRPTSLGTITLNSSNPFDSPIMDPHYLETQHDVDVLVRAVKLLLRIAQSKPLGDSVDPTGLKNPLLDHHLFNASDAELADFVRKRAQTLYHPTCTARMAKLEDEGVVDGRLRVYGIEGLRVVDASVFPTIVAGHTTAPVIAVAELAADMIKEDFKAA